MDGFDLHYPILADRDLMLRMENKGIKALNTDTFIAHFAMTGLSQNINGLYKRSQERYKILKNNRIPNPIWETVKYIYKNFFSHIYRKLIYSFKIVNNDNAKYVQ